MNIPIELLGHKCRLTNIFSRTKLEPWYPEDELLVNVEFDNPEEVEGIISTAISIPVANYYSREVFLKVVKEKGEKQLAVAIAKHTLQQEQAKAESGRKKDLDVFAHKLEAHLEQE